MASEDEGRCNCITVNRNKGGNEGAGGDVPPLCDNESQHNAIHPSNVGSRGTFFREGFDRFNHIGQLSSTTELSELEALSTSLNVWFFQVK